jgi:hypothetical protein
MSFHFFLHDYFDSCCKRLFQDMSEEITNNMVWIDADKWHIRSHTMGKSFWLDRFEVTQK